MKLARHIRLCLVGGLAAALWLSAQAPPALHGTVTVEEFKINEYRPDGTLDWTVVGDRAVLAGDQATITRVEATIHQTGTVYVLQTPTCVLDRRRKVASSGEPVSLRSEKVAITGHGFDLDLGRHVLVVRDRVQILAYNSDLPSLGKSAD